MGPELDNNRLVEMRLSVEKDLRKESGMDFSNIEDIENIRNKFPVTKDRGVLQETKCLVKYDEKNMTNDDRELMNFGSTLQTRYVENWINETLREHEECQLPTNLPRRLIAEGAVTPLAQYDTDRVSLQLLGIPNEKIDRIFRALYVHSVGLFNLLRDTLKHVVEGKDATMTNFWQVYQMLLEHTCKVDYSMVTQQLTKRHEREIQNLNDKIIALNTIVTIKDAELQRKMEALNIEYDILDARKTKMEIEREKMVETMLRIESRFEEEVNLRLMFENKLNSLHMINNESDSQVNFLSKELDWLKTENKRLHKVSDQASQQNIYFHDCQMRLQDKIQRTADELELTKFKIVDKQKEIKFKDNKMLAMMEIRQNTLKSLDETKTDLRVRDMDIGKLRNEIFSQEIEKKMIKKTTQNALDLIEFQKERIQEVINQCQEKTQEMHVVEASKVVLLSEIQRLKSQLDHALIKVTQLTKRDEDWEHKYGTILIKNKFLITEQDVQWRKNRIRDENEARIQLLNQDSQLELRRQIDGNHVLLREKAILERLYAEAKQESIEIVDKVSETEKSLEESKLENEKLQNKLENLQMKNNAKGIKIMKERLETSQKAEQGQNKEKQKFEGITESLKLHVKQLQIDLISKDSTIAQMKIKINHQQGVIDHIDKRKRNSIMEYSNYVDNNNHVFEQQSLYESKINFLDERNKQEGLIYQEKIQQLNEKIQRMRMPIEDAQSSLMRAGDRYDQLMKVNEKLNAEIKFVGKRYAASLVSRYMGTMRMYRTDQTIRELELKIHQHDNELALQGDKMKILEFLTDKLKERYNNKQVQKMMPGVQEQLVDLLKQSQITESKLEIKEKEVQSLQEQLFKLIEKYSPGSSTDQMTQIEQSDLNDFKKLNPSKTTQTIDKLYQQALIGNTIKKDQKQYQSFKGRKTQQITSSQLASSRKGTDSDQKEKGNRSKSYKTDNKKMTEIDGGESEDEESSSRISNESINGAKKVQNSKSKDKKNKEKVQFLEQDESSSKENTFELIKKKKMTEAIKEKELEKQKKVMERKEQLKQLGQLKMANRSKTMSAMNMNNLQQLKKMIKPKTKVVIRKKNQETKGMSTIDQTIEIKKSKKSIVNPDGYKEKMKTIKKEQSEKSRINSVLQNSIEKIRSDSESKSKSKDSVYKEKKRHTINEVQNIMNFSNVYNKVQQSLDKRYPSKNRKSAMIYSNENVSTKLINVTDQQIKEIHSSKKSSSSSTSENNDTSETQSVNLENQFVSSMESNDESNQHSAQELNDETIIQYMEQLEPIEINNLITKINKLPMVNMQVGVCFRCRAQLRSEENKQMFVRIKPKKELNYSKMGIEDLKKHAQASLIEQEHIQKTNYFKMHLARMFENKQSSTAGISQPSTTQENSVVDLSNKKILNNIKIIDQLDRPTTWRAKTSQTMFRNTALSKNKLTQHQSIERHNYSTCSQQKSTGKNQMKINNNFISQQSDNSMQPSQHHLSRNGFLLGDGRAHTSFEQLRSSIKILTSQDSILQNTSVLFEKPSRTAKFIDQGNTSQKQYKLPIKSTYNNNYMTFMKHKNNFKKNNLNNEDSIANYQSQGMQFTQHKVTIPKLGQIELFDEI